MISKNEFAVLYRVLKQPGLSQRDLADACDLSLGTINASIKQLKCKGLLAETLDVTDEGIEALAPYKVDNAIIMAAGLSSRFAPISYERPKGVLKVRGEVLIERQIEQLRAAGIDDITIVVGYKKEEFFYLGDKYGIDVVVNPYYAQRNNNSTLYLVRDRLKNTYICSSDDYFTENVFESHVYQAYYSAEFSEGPTAEYCMQTGAHGLITKVTVGGENAWYMIGHAYFDRGFSEKFISVLERVYDLPETEDKLWEDVYLEHIDELPLTIRKYGNGIINEFDSLEELRLFDEEFIDNVDSEILDNICHILKCVRKDVRDVTPIKKGLTNMSFKFSVNGESYVYRHPGPATAGIINRKSETFSQQVARELDIDDTFIYENPDEGWKISRFIEGCVPFDYHNDEHVETAMRMARFLHQSGNHAQWEFNVYKKALDIVAELERRDRISFRDFGEIADSVARVYDFLVKDEVPSCLCHNDFYDPNFLVGPDRIRLIDWEYSGESDYASDLGTFICCSDYTYEEAIEVLNRYFEGAMTADQKKHCVGYICVSSFYWFVWAIYQDVLGNPVGEYLYLWYRYTKLYAQKALELRQA